MLSGGPQSNLTDLIAPKRAGDFDMTAWKPLGWATVIAIAINAFPAFMAFVVGDEDWVAAGWALYVFLIPLGILLVIVGLVWSIIRARR